MRSVGDGFVPYTELIQLGGNESARGYTRGYFRGQGALQFNVEYRYPIWDYSNVFLFWDEGQIFDHFGDLRWGGFHSSWGGVFISHGGRFARAKSKLGIVLGESVSSSDLRWGQGILEDLEDILYEKGLINCGYGCLWPVLLPRLKRSTAIYQLRQSSGLIPIIAVLLNPK